MHIITRTSLQPKGISNFWQPDCFFNSLFRLTAKKISMLHITGPFVREIHWWLVVDSPHKALVMWKAFPCHDGLMMHNDYHLFNAKPLSKPTHTNNEKDPIEWYHLIEIKIHIFSFKKMLIICRVITSSGQGRDQWLSARLQYLQCISNGDTAVLRQAI